MDVIIMPSITSLINSLSGDFPHLVFTPANEFRWLPSAATIYYDTDSNDLASLLHEVAHGALGHTDYLRDVELIQLERDAWEHAKTKLAPRYSLTISNDAIEDALDTYRDWLHARSLCPVCSATGVQHRKNEYRCIACSTRWHVNDARTCMLRRYLIAK